jgi:hypothetical protein
MYSSISAMVDASWSVTTIIPASVGFLPVAACLAALGVITGVQAVVAIVKLAKLSLIGVKRRKHTEQTKLDELQAAATAWLSKAHRYSV